MNRDRNHDFTAILKEAPESEPDRQRFFIAKAKLLAEEKSIRLGRPLTCCINTFGCQMNSRDSEKLMGVLEAVGYVPVEDEDEIGRAHV